MEQKRRDGGPGEVNPDGVRLNKYLSDAGFCSRREADRLILDGRVSVDGKTASLGDKIIEGRRVRVDGRPVGREERKVLLAYHKPRGIVCTAEKREKNNVVDSIHYPIRIYPVGRLDKDSEGLLLLTNMGELVNKIMRAGNFHEKEYVVRVDRPVSEEFLQGMAGGVPILDTVTRPCAVSRIPGREREFKIILTQGLNRQIRRMCEHFGCRVERLKRVRIMNIRLGGLKPGEYREINGGEWEELMRLLKDSRSKPVRIETDGERKRTWSHIKSDTGS